MPMCIKVVVVGTYPTLSRVFGCLVYFWFVVDFSVFCFYIEFNEINAGCLPKIMPILLGRLTKV